MKNFRRKMKAKKEKRSAFQPWIGRKNVYREGGGFN